MSGVSKHKWEFRPRFRRHAFGWRSQPAIKRIREAVSEIKKVARKDGVLAAEGAVLFLEKVSPAIEHVDSSSGSIGTAVNSAIAALTGIIAAAAVDTKTREAWLERLFQAHADDGIPYIESLADHWGELCASPEVASGWADRLMAGARAALGPGAGIGGHFRGTSACLSATFAAGRFDELVDLLRDERFWPYRRWAVRALAAQGKKAEAIRLAESSRGPWASDLDIDRLCEEMLLTSGLVGEAYRRYGVGANRAPTYVAWFRAVAKKYAHIEPSQLLDDLVAATPGEEGKWFAAAKEAKLFDEAIALAKRTPCAPQTLTRAARDFEEVNPEFAVEAGLAALHWLEAGYGFDITGTDVLAAYAHTVKAAENAGRAEETRRRIRDRVTPDSFVGKVLGHRLELS